MLVLSRKKNESIIVDDTIVITVVEIRGDKVRLGIEAPREVSIHRSEVRDAIQAGIPLQATVEANIEITSDESIQATAGTKAQL